MKGTFRIGGAALLGVLIVLVALYVSIQKATSMEGPEGSITVNTSTTRTSIETKDANGNGVPDWQESLASIATAKILSSTTTQQVSGEYAPPTTLTGKFSEAFLKDYLEGKMRGKDFSDPTTFVEEAIATIETNTKSKLHTRAELSLVPSTMESLRTYGNEIVTITDRHSIESENEIAIFAQSLETEDATILERLQPLERAYRNIIVDTLKVSVPDILARQHVDLLNVYEAILLDITAMQEVFSDPLFAIARVRTYAADADALSASFRNIGDTLEAQGIRYTNDEAGSFFYIFDAL